MRAAGLSADVVAAIVLSIMIWMYDKSHTRYTTRMSNPLDTSHASRTCVCRMFEVMFVAQLCRTLKVLFVCEMVTSSLFLWCCKYGLYVSRDPEYMG
jgi:hypothetical protein